VEVTAGDDATQFGPYSVTFKVTNSLDQNMPNPFNPATTIRYSIAQDENVSLVVYDVAGRQVRTLVENRQRADVYKVTWDGVNDHGERVASGMYFYRLAAGKFVETRKMMLLK
jgi:flagellar hook assembly protein FlgD